MTEQRRISRRALLIGGAGVVGLGVATVAGIETGIVPGRSTLYNLLGLNGERGEIPQAMPGPRVSGEFVSAARLGATCGWTIAYPPGASPGDALNVLVVLHGYNAGHRTPFDRIGLDRFLAEGVGAGMPPYAIAAVDGGNSYWHQRASGEDSGAMVTDEFLPLLGERGLEVDRIALLGWSMGGFGALLLARRLGRDRVAAVVAESPAMWVDSVHSPDGAFDDAEDYEAHDLEGRQSELDGIPVRIDSGAGDGFTPVVRHYVAGFADAPAGGFQPGGHDFGYWTRMAPEQLEFVGEHLVK